VDGSDLRPVVAVENALDLPVESRTIGAGPIA
jgi:hypothetical protein